MKKGVFIVILLILLCNIFATEKCLRLNGVNNYVELTPIPRIIPKAHSFSILIWVKASTNQTSNTFEVLSQDAGLFGTHFYFGKNASGKIRLGDGWQDTGIDFPVDNQWHHYAIVRSDNDTKLFIDGEFKANSGYAIGTPNGQVFRFGKQYGWHTEYFKGDIDEVKIFKSALNNEKVLKFMHDKIALPMNSEYAAVALHSYFDFEQGTAANVTERVQNKVTTILNGTIKVNSTAFVGNTITKTTSANSLGWSLASENANNVFMDVKFSSISDTPVNVAFNKFSSLPTGSNIASFGSDIVNQACYSLAIDANTNDYNLNELKFRIDENIEPYYLTFPQKVLVYIKNKANEATWISGANCVNVTSTQGKNYIHFFRYDLMDYLEANPGIAFKKEPFHSITSLYPSDESIVGRYQTFEITTDATETLPYSNGIDLIYDGQVIETITTSDLMFADNKIRFKFNTALQANKRYTIIAKNGFAQDENRAPFLGITDASAWNVIGASTDDNLGNCASFDGAKEIVVNKAVIPTTGDFTVAFWAKPQTDSGFTEFISQSPGFFIGRNPSGTIRAPWATNVPYPSDDKWHYFTVTKKQNEAHLYIDGNLKSSFEGNIVTNGSLFKIANQYGAYNEHYKGCLDEIKIWKKALMIDEITDAMYNVVAYSDFNLVSHWQFNYDNPTLNIFDPISGNTGIANSNINFVANDMQEFKCKYTFVDFEGPGIHSIDSLNIVIEVPELVNYNKVRITTYSQKNLGLPQELNYSLIGQGIEVTQVDSLYWNITYVYDDAMPNQNLTFKFNKNLSQLVNAQHTNLVVVNKPVGSNNWNVIPCDISLQNNSVTINSTTAEGDFCLVKLSLPTYETDTINVADTLTTYTSNVTKIAIKSKLLGEHKISHINCAAKQLPSTYTDDFLNKTYNVSPFIQEFWKIETASNTRSDLTFMLDENINVPMHKLLLAKKDFGASNWVLVKPYLQNMLIENNLITVKDTKINCFVAIVKADDLPYYTCDKMYLNQNDYIYDSNITRCKIERLQATEETSVNSQYYGFLPSNNLPTHFNGESPDERYPLDYLGDCYWKIDFGLADVNYKLTVNLENCLQANQPLESKYLYFLNSADGNAWTVVDTVSAIDFDNNLVTINSTNLTGYFIFTKKLKTSYDVVLEATEYVVDVNQEVDSHITIKNTGNTKLDYLLHFGVYSNIYRCENAPTVDSTFTAYTFSVSDGSDDVGYEWHDIEQNENQILLPSAPMASIKKNLGFDFNYYGNIVDSVAISSMCNVIFGKYSSSTFKGLINMLNFDSFRIDQNISKIYCKSNPDSFIVTYKNLVCTHPTFNENNPDSLITLQAILYSNDDIKIQYKKVPDSFKYSQHKCNLQGNNPNENCVFSYRKNIGGSDYTSNWFIKSNTAVIFKQSFNSSNLIGTILPNQEAILPFKYKQPFTSYAFDEFFCKVMNDTNSRYKHINFKHEGILKAPKNVKVEALTQPNGDTFVDISWDKVFNASTYKVFGKTESGNFVDITASMEFEDDDSGCYYIIPRDSEKIMFYYIKALLNTDMF